MRASQTVISVVSRDDAPAGDAALGAEIILSPKGTCAQRNTALDHLDDDADLIVFFDDDFVPAPDYLEAMAKLFTERPALIGATGAVLMDGVKTAGISFEEADAIIASHVATPGDIPTRERKRVSLYGCNMVYRVSAIKGLRFDERLPLYGWLEDIDFSARARKNGELIETGRLAGVHLGVKGGRTSGVRFGYSQIANPTYLFRKGTMTLHHSADNIVRNLISNHIRMFAPEAHVDRWGRVKGNWLAIADIARGRLTPERILDL